MCLTQRRHILCQCIRRHSRIRNGRPHGRIVPAVPLPAPHAELTAVIQGRMPRQSEHGEVAEGQMRLVLQLVRQPVHIMVFQKGIEASGDLQVSPQIVRNLKKIMGIEARVNGLMQFIICHGVQCLRVHPAGILPVNHLAHQPEIRLPVCRTAPQILLKGQIQHIRTVQPQPVNIKFPHPEIHRGQQVLPDGSIGEIQLRQLPGTTPGAVAEGIPLGRAPAEVNALVPVPVRRHFPLLLYVPKSEKAPARVVEHRVHHHPDSKGMGLVHEVPEIRIAAQPPVYPPIICRIVAVTAGLEKRSDIDGIDAERPEIGKIGDQRRKAMPNGTVLICFFCGDHAEGIHMIENRTVEPGHVVPPKANFLAPYRCIASRCAIWRLRGAPRLIRHQKNP